LFGCNDGGNSGSVPGAWLALPISTPNCITQNIPKLCEKKEKKKRNCKHKLDFFISFNVKFLHANQCENKQKQKYKFNWREWFRVWGKRCLNTIIH
jgi:hypothetical protein